MGQIQELPLNAMLRRYGVTAVTVTGENDVVDKLMDLLRRSKRARH